MINIAGGRHRSPAPTDIINIVRGRQHVASCRQQSSTLSAVVRGRRLHSTVYRLPSTVYSLQSTVSYLPSSTLRYSTSASCIYFNLDCYTTGLCTRYILIKYFSGFQLSCLKAGGEPGRPQPRFFFLLFTVLTDCVRLFVANCCSY